MGFTWNKTFANEYARIHGFSRDYAITLNIVYSLELISELHRRRGFTDYLITDWRIARMTELTFLTDFNDPEILSLAQILTHRSKIDTIAAMWMAASSLNVDKDIVNFPWQSRRASDVLKRGTGVCADRSILLCALLRAANIPAMITTGIWYGDYHSWVEVYYWGKWRILDPSNEIYWHPIGRVFIKEYLIKYDAKIEENYIPLDRNEDLNSSDPFKYDVIDLLPDIAELPFRWPDWVIPRLIPNLGSMFE